jgi:hypothetical protein
MLLSVIAQSPAFYVKRFLLGSQDYGLFRCPSCKGFLRKPSRQGSQAHIGMPLSSDPGGTLIGTTLVFSKPLTASRCSHTIRSMILCSHCRPYVTLSNSPENPPPSRARNREGGSKIWGISARSWIHRIGLRSYRAGRAGKRTATSSPTMSSIIIF